MSRNDPIRYMYWIFLAGPSCVGIKKPQIVEQQPVPNQQLQLSNEKEVSQADEEGAVASPVSKESPQSTKKSRSISESTSDPGTVVSVHVLFKKYIHIENTCYKCLLLLLFIIIIIIIEKIVEF